MCVMQSRPHITRLLALGALHFLANPRDVSQTLSEQSQWRKQQSEDSIMSCCEEGCEDAFLASYCCDADELQTFKLERIARF